MNYKHNLFNSIKLLYLAVILVEADTIRKIIQPVCFYEYLHISTLINTYLEHLILSIIILTLGALIFLKKT